jgi:hypothetical protein
MSSSSNKTLEAFLLQFSVDSDTPLDPANLTKFIKDACRHLGDTLEKIEKIEEVEEVEKKPGYADVNGNANLDRTTATTLATTDPRPLLQPCVDRPSPSPPSTVLSATLLDQATSSFISSLRGTLRADNAKPPEIDAEISLAALTSADVRKLFADYNRHLLSTMALVDRRQDHDDELHYDSEVNSPVQEDILRVPDSPISRLKSFYPEEASSAPSSEDRDIETTTSISTSGVGKISSATAKIHPQSSTISSLLNSQESVLWQKVVAEDDARQKRLAKLLRTKKIRYTSTEEQFLTDGLGLLAAVKMKGITPFKDYPSGQLSTVAFARGFYNAKSGDIYGHSECNIAARLEDAVAYQFDYGRKAVNPAFRKDRKLLEEDQEVARKLRAKESKITTLPAGVIESLSPHHNVIYQDYNFPKPLINREVIFSAVIKMLSKNSALLVWSPLDTHPLVEIKDTGAVIRGTMQAAILFTQIDAGECKMEFAYHINFGGQLPAFIAEGYLIPRPFRATHIMATHFIMSIKLANLVEKDGKLLGEVAVNQIKAAQRRGTWKQRGENRMMGVDEFLYISVAMRELLETQPWLKSLLKTIVRNNVAPSKTVHKMLDEITDQDAVVLAKGLITIILSNTTSETAVDHWINQNSALGEFEAIYPWSRPFFIELSQHSLNTSNFGVVMRVSVGAALSTVDLASDLYVTYTFLNSDALLGYGQLNASLIGLTMGLQIFVAYGQNKTKLREFLKDVVIIASGLKPAYDAFKIGTGAEQMEHQKFDPLLEMTFCKCIETVFEAIPSSIIQIYAILASGDFGKIAIASILISGATTAFTSVMITYDWDTSPSKRAKNNKNFKFYGFVPDGATPRTVCFAAMFMFTTAHTLARSFSCALLAVVSKKFIAIYLVGDMLIYVLYKLLRGDLRYGPNLSKVLSALGTAVIRFTDKLLVDFTAMMQIRHPGQAGGLYWTASLIMSQLGCFACGWVYLTYFENEEGGKKTKLAPRVVWSIIGSLCGVFVICWTAFLLVMNREFMGTFFSNITYASYLQKWFTGIPDGDDEQKSAIFKKHPICRRMVEGDARAWTLANWEKWEAKKPAWFTDAWIDSVPNDCIPFNYCVKYKKTKGRHDKRRASVSVKEMLGGKGEAR